MWKRAFIFALCGLNIGKSFHPGSRYKRLTEGRTLTLCRKRAKFQIALFLHIFYKHEIVDLKLPLVDANGLYIEATFRL
jgi:hypothetical protein